MPVTVTRRFIMQKARRHCSRQLRPLVGAWFQDLFHSPCRSAFHLSSLSVSWECLALPDGPGGFAQDSSCPALLRIPLGPSSLRIQVSHLLRSFFPEASAHDSGTTAWSYYPANALLHPRFGLVPVRSPLLGESLFIFFSSRY